MAGETKEVFPIIPKIAPDNIPDLLKTTAQWIIWRAGPLKPSGKFDKIPTNPANGKNINPLDPKNWLTHEAAVAAHEQEMGDGIGIVMSSKHPVKHNGEEHYLVALDFDQYKQREKEIKELWLRLGKPYVEVSPSGKGLRMFALSKELLKGGNDGNGHELYCRDQFLTVTGWQGRGQIKDATPGLITVHQHWFGTKERAHEPQSCELGSNLSPIPRAEINQNVALVREMLSVVPSDTDYATWRDILWSIMSTGWTCAEQIALEWSMQAEHRFDETAFDSLVRSFDPNRGITLGTLYHHAEQNGWTKPKALNSAKPSVALAAARLLTAAEVKAQPNLPYRVRGLLPAQGVVAIYGESGSGKSFLAIDLGLSIGGGHTDWFGMAVKPAPVAYIALEGRGGISKRIMAWEAHNQQLVAGQVRFVLSDFTLLDNGDVEKLGAEILASLGPGAVVVVDTLNQSAPGADENASADMGRILANAKLLADRVLGLVILIHHSGKDRARGMRGHSSLFAAMDAVIEVSNSASGRAWNATKAKDDQPGMCYDFELVRYIVGQDDDGFDIASCAVRRCMHIPVVKAKPLIGKHQKPAMATLRPLLAGNPGGMSHQDAIKAVAAVLTCAPGRRTSVAKETIKRLSTAGHLCLDEGGLVKPQ